MAACLCSEPVIPSPEFPEERAFQLTTDARGALAVEVCRQAIHDPLDAGAYYAAQWQTGTSLSCDPVIAVSPDGEHWTTYCRLPPLASGPFINYARGVRRCAGCFAGKLHLTVKWT